MNEPMEIRIDTARIPKDAGIILKNGTRTSLKIKSMKAMKRWVLDDLPECENITFIVAGSMPNCAAVQIGLWLAGLGDVYFETVGGFRRKMDVV